MPPDSNCKLSNLEVAELAVWPFDIMKGQQLNSTEGASNMQLIQLFCKWLGVPLAIYKSKGPYAAVWFAELDTANMIVHLPADNRSPSFQSGNISKHVQIMS